MSDTVTDTASDCSVCRVSRAAVGRLEEWRVYGSVRVVHTPGGDVDRGHVTVFCPDCSTAIDAAEADMSLYAALAGRAPGLADDAAHRHSFAMFLGRILMSSVRLKPEQVPAFVATFE